MGWFENQIEERRDADQQLLEDSFVRIAGVVLGERTAQRISDERIIMKNAIDEILECYHLKPVEVPEEIKTSEEQLDYCLRRYGIMRRSVVLEEGWYKDAYGPILAFTKEGGLPVALVPGKVLGYVYNDSATGERKRVSAQTASILDTEAFCFYRPLPQKKLGIPDLMLYIKSCLSLSDAVMIGVSTLAVTLVSLFMPRITRMLTGPVLSSGRADALIGIAICMVCVSISSYLLNGVKGLVQSRLDIKTTLGVRASMMMRLLTLPADFFRIYSPGELKSRSMSVNQLCSMMMNMVMSTVLTSLTSLLYVGQIFRFAPALTMPSIAIILVTTGFSVVSTLAQIRINRMLMERSAKESGMSYGFITGVQMIKLAGAEKRVFAKWLNIYAEGAELKYNPRCS